MTDQESLLASLNSPADLKRLSFGQLTSLASEIRQFLVDKVTTTGGHLGPNLGVVELTMAIHRVFDSPRDAVVFDVGHQAYVHKIITGRRADFDGLRLAGGISGYPSRAECEHDLVENSHASTALSYADGLAKAFELRGERRHVVAVVGDGALTGGMCWEALNNIAAGSNRPMVIVINDNGRSYSHTIGGLADHLASLRLSPGYEKALEGGKRMLQGTPVVGKPIYAALHAAKRGIKDALSPQMMFEDLGLKYFGPVDGHDHVALDAALRRAREFGGPVIVHAVTSKGRGFPLAENDEVDQMHQTDPIDPVTGKPTTAKGPASWTSVFADELARIGDERPDVVAITAAMLRSTGLAKFAEAYPDRWFDVGIAEQHAVTSAAGMAMAGLHPVVAIYSTFLNRAFDQLLMDVALHRLPVTLVLDRAGITGPDGASHHGMWDLSILGAVPGIRIAAPRDAISLREELGEAIAVKDGPTVLRFPKASVGGEVGALERLGPVDVLRRGESPDVLLVTVGAFAELGMAAADRLADQGIGVTVVDPRWVAPVPAELVTLAAAHRLVVTVEDGGRHGGFGWALAAALRDAEVEVPLRDLGIPQEFHGQGTRSEVLVRLGLTAQNVARRVTEWASGRLGETQSAEVTRHTDA